MPPSHEKRDRKDALETTEVARLLVELGHRTELAGESPFKARAYHRAAEALCTLTVPLGEVVARGALQRIPGVGAAIADKITSFHHTGTHPTLEALRKKLPPGVLDMLRIPGLSTKQVLQIHQKLGIASIDELAEACNGGALPEGLSPALHKRIVQGLEMFRRGQGRRLLHRASEFLAQATAHLKDSHPQLRRIVPAGDVRRGCEVVADLRLVAEAPGLRAPSAIQLTPEITLHLTDTRLYGAALLMATGAGEHVEALKALAGRQGLTLDEGGLKRGERLVAGEDEAGIYAALGLQFVPPELREGRDEIALALAHRLPRLVTDADLRGLIHAHTHASDGANSLEEMAEATRERGYGYFGVADHSQTAGYAGGLKPAEIAAQHAEADALNARYRGRFRILKGIESDILEDGSLDYPEEVLRSFDYVVASVHSRFGLDPEEQTERILRAVANPHTTVLGHMTGRKLLEREGYEIDMERVLAACAEHDVAVEINANPHRLDLDWRWQGRALALGCRVSINPDAHSVAELDLTHWGVLMARKGGVPRDRVLNCLDWPDLAAHLDAKRAKASERFGASRPAGRGGRSRARR